LLLVEECDPKVCARLNRAWHSVLPRLELPTVKGKTVCYAATFEGTIYAAAGWTNEHLSRYSEWGTRRRRVRAAGFIVAPSTRKPSQVKSDKIRWAKYREGKKR